MQERIVERTRSLLTQEVLLGSYAGKRGRGSMLNVSDDDLEASTLDGDDDSSNAMRGNSNNQHEDESVYSSEDFDDRTTTGTDGGIDEVRDTPEYMLPIIARRVGW